MNLLGIVERLRDERNQSDEWCRSRCYEAANLIEKMGEVLKECEAAGAQGERGDAAFGFCPVCDLHASKCHTPDCKLAACLKEIST